MSVRIELQKSFFNGSERPLCESGEFSVSAFSFDSGVDAIRIKNSRGEIVVLPYQGMQVWRARFDGRELTMNSMFDRPKNTRIYLETYGAFLLHCGVTGLGAPGPTDSHPLHGELPNAPMDKAWLDIDANRGLLSVSAQYQHTVAFATNYRATISTTMSAGSALLDVSVDVDNLKNTTMDLMYLAHVNFRPVDDGELHYSANYTAQDVRVRKSIPGHVIPKPGYEEFLEQLSQDPTLHHKLEPGLRFDPEVVFEIELKADADGYGHALQKHPGDFSDYISYRPSEAPVCMRWICRTPDQDGLGIAFPATSGVEGYTIEKGKDRVVQVAGGDTWRIAMRMGHLTAMETTNVINTIDQIRAEL
ncbi:MAG: DUF4432 family protein [Granulosicoccus sp.]|nr:DUF4432 family protein [Granulosicoccus sp.]